jgi:iron complex outermembrane receptor protein
VLFFAALSRALADADPPSEIVEVNEAAPDGPDPAATSASVTVLRPDARQSAATDVGSLVESAAGTNVQRLGGLGDFTAVSIRGASLRQVEVFFDGVPLNPDGAAVVDLSQLPLGAFERVEVWRGNAPLSFASSAVGGVVNLVPRADDGGRASAAYGSWDTARATVYGGGRLGRPGAAGAVAPRAEGFVEAFHSRGDFRYFSDNATLYNLLDDHLVDRENNDKLQLSGFVRATAAPGPRLSLLLVPLYREEGLPGQANLPAASARLETTRNVAVADALFAGDTWRARLSGWHLYAGEHLADPDGELDGTVRDQQSDSHTFGLRASATWAPASWLAPTATLSARRESIDITDAQLADDPVRTRLAGSLGLGADLRFWSDRVTVSPALQLAGLDNRALGEVADTQAGSDPDDVPFFGTADPRLGLLVRPLPRLALKANAGSYLRPPDLVELFGNHGALEGSSTLRPERGGQFDVGARLDGPPLGPVRLAIDVAAFWLFSEDRIVWVQNSQKSMTPVNFGRTWVQGVEASVNAAVFDHLDLDGSLTWQLSRNLTEGSAFANNELPRTPSLAVWAGPSVHWAEHVRLGYTFNYTAPNYWDAGNLYLSAPRTLHGAFVRARPGPRWPSLELAGLNLANRITEVVPRNPADPDDDARSVAAITDFAGYPLPGRTLLFSASWEL